MLRSAWHPSAHSPPQLPMHPTDNRYNPVEKPLDTVKLMQPDIYRLNATEQEVTTWALAEYRSLLEEGGVQPAAYIVESIMCCGGQVFLPEGYLRGMFELTRQYGGLAISDEVSTSSHAFTGALVAFGGASRKLQTARMPLAYQCTSCAPNALRAHRYCICRRCQLMPCRCRLDLGGLGTRSGRLSAMAPCQTSSRWASRLATACRFRRS